MLNDDEVTPDRTWSRRRMLAGGGAIAGAVWIAPSVLTVHAAAAGSALVSVVAGSFVHVQGNATTFKASDMPVGTFTRLVLVVSIVADNLGSTGPTATQPIAVSTPGWTLVRHVEDGVAPAFAVFTAAPGAAPPAVSAQNLTNGRLTGVVLGWTGGTTVTTSPIASGAAPGTSLTVASTTASTPSTWVFAGSASDGSAANNWATLPAGTWTPVVVPDVSGNNNTPPDLYVARNGALLTTISSLTETFKAGGSTGTNYGARGIFIGVG